MRYRKTLSTLLLLAVAATASGCGAKPAGEYRFKNANFETGTLSGWTAEGDAFTESCVEIASKDDAGRRFYQEGDFFLYGRRAGLAATGTLQSETFRLFGNGKIGFLIGAGKNASACYVALCSAKDGKELAVRGNTEFDESAAANLLHRVIIDGGQWIGEKVYIKIVDRDSGSDGYNYINADDFIVNYQGGEDRVGLLFAAEKYVQENLNSVNPRYRHTYHAMPPLGWMNDPNGFSYALGKVHLFYQFHPYAPQWGPMHWGHYTTEDFVKWAYQPIALAPDTPYDAEGCFSGSALEKDETMYLVYTSVAGGRQTQSVALSTDGVRFEKLGNNPVMDGGLLPSGASKNDFRDPKVFERDGAYYAVVGSRAGDGGGQVLLYRSTNLTNWAYAGTLIHDKRTNGIYECPDLFRLSGRDVLFTSPQGFARQGWRHENVHSNLYMVGELNANTGTYTYSYEDEIDSGFDFYAPQTLQMPDGRRVMIAWMQMWGRSMPTQADNWAGAMTLPRELILRDGKLYQTPVREIEAYRRNPVSHANVPLAGETELSGVTGNTVELQLELDLGNAARTGVKLFVGGGNETAVYFDRESGLVVFDRSRSGTRITGEEASASVRHTQVDTAGNRLKLRIFLDKSSAEIFFNDGERTMTGNVYNEGATGITFFSEGGSASVVSLTKYDIAVN